MEFYGKLACPIRGGVEGTMSELDRVHDIKKLRYEHYCLDVAIWGRTGAQLTIATQANRLHSIKCGLQAGSVV